MALPLVDLPGLDFRPGIGVQTAIQERYGSPINFKPGSGQTEFLLVASIGRCIYRLSEESVSHILQATIGGNAADFRPAQLDDRLFRFSVSSKAVGFHIYQLQSYECKQYKILFHLWGAGGAQWNRERKEYEQEEAASWQVVNHKKKKSYADAVRQPQRLRSSKSVTTSMPIVQQERQILFTGSNTAPINQQERQAPLTGANTVPITQKRRFTAPHGRQSVFTRLSSHQEGPRKSVFERLTEGDSAIRVPLADARRKGKEPTREPGRVNQGIQISNTNGLATNRNQKVQYRIIRDNRAQQSSPQAFPTRGDRRQRDQVIMVCGYKCVICSRCLQSGHTSAECTGRVKCRRCHKSGHIKVICRSRKARGGFRATITGQSKDLGQFWPADVAETWFRQPITKPGPSTPPQFGSIQEVGKDFIAFHTVPRASPPSKVSTLLQLSLPNHTPATPPRNYIEEGDRQTLPSQALAAATMYRRADPRRFLPPGFRRIAVQGREPAVRAVAARPQLRHEDIAIVTIDPMPQGEALFGNIRNVLLEFLVDYKRLSIKDIQPCHLGQAYVRFTNIHDRDNMVETGPHPYGNVEFRFVRHNEGRNRRAVNFNRECWLMLLGFPLDYWHQHYIENAITSFGRLTGWHNDPSNLARLLIRARVTELEDVPEFIVLTEGEGFQGFSWTIQVEILQQNMIGELPADEDPVPPPNYGQAPILYDFFGFGQVGPAPFEPEPENEEAQEAQDAEQNWAPWEEDNVADAAPAAQAPNLDLNEEPAQQEDAQHADVHMQEPQEEIIQGEAVQIHGEAAQMNQEQPVPGEVFFELADFVGEFIEGMQANSDVISGEAPANSEGSHNQNVAAINQEVDQHINILEDAQPDGEEVILALAAALEEPLAFIAEDVPMEELIDHEHHMHLDLDLNAPPEQEADVQEEMPINGMPEQQLQAIQGPELNQLMVGQQIVLPEQQLQGAPAIQPDEEGLEGHREHNIQVGYMMHMDTDVDPVFQSLCAYQGPKVVKPHPDLYRLWAKYFEPAGRPESVITIPTRWASFFTKLLLTPEGFDWAKGFLISQAWQVLCEEDQDKLHFKLPDKCPVDSGPLCMKQMNDTSEDEEPVTPPGSYTVTHSANTTSEAHVKKKRCRPAPLVITDVRRSPRIKDKLKGFKADHCTSNTCYACSSAPPTLSPSMIKNLGNSFCKVPLEELSVSKLTTKRRVQKAIGKEGTSKNGNAPTGPTKAKKAVAKKVVKKPNNDGPNEENKSKKPKK
ncbi:hypothetical protein EJB05_12866, partial [Eragrostis curvula]